MFEDDNNEVETSEETQDEVELDSYEEESTEDVEEDEQEEKIDWEARAKKAEQTIEKAKQKQKKAPAVTTNGLSTVDIIALTRANINDDDIDEVLEYASFKKISVSEALKSSVVKATIAERDEKRKSASAVHSGNTRRATGGTSDDRLLDNARNGRLPESDADIQRLAELRLKNKRR